MNLFSLGPRTVIVDFAHNEAGTQAILDVARGVARAARAAGGPPIPVTAIIGTGGDRPDDTLRGIGRIAARMAQRVAVKETKSYLRGRPREEVVARLLEGIAEGGMDPATVPLYQDEPGALEAELAIAGDADGAAGAGRPGVVVLFCHEARDDVFALLERLGARPLDAQDGLDRLRPEGPGAPR
jgi:cyanophycin synthetase